MPKLPKPNFRFSALFVTVSRGLAVTLGITAAICAIASNSVEGEDGARALLITSYVLCFAASACILAMLLSNSVGWSDEEVDQGYRGPNRDD